MFAGKRPLVLPIGIGYLGAALRYSGLAGFDLPAWLRPVTHDVACPPCVNLTMIGPPPLVRFFGETVVFGTLNALLFSIVAWLIFGGVRRLGRAVAGPTV